jgi:hypothetical protein
MVNVAINKHTEVLNKLEKAMKRWYNGWNWKIWFKIWN